MVDNINNGPQVDVQISRPLILTDKQKWICAHLDNLNKVALFCPKNSPSDLFKGALYAMRPDNRINTDWMAQASHSLREIMYGVGTAKTLKDKLKENIVSFLFSFKYFKKITIQVKEKIKPSRSEQLVKILGYYQEDIIAKDIAARLNYFHSIFTNIAHHSQEGWKAGKIIGNLKKLGIIINGIADLDDSKFELLVENLQNIWVESIPRQIKIHKKVDEILSSPPQTIDRKKLNILLSLNEDAKRYFFIKADETWLDWLWQNKLLDAIKEKTLNESIYRMPELDYLANVAAKSPKKVTDIILNVESDQDNFNIEVVSRFLWISSALPGEQIARLISKIKEENWVKLMNKSNNWGFEYEKMLEELVKIEDYNSLLSLIDVILTVRSKEDIHDASNEYIIDNPFYFNDLSQIKLFRILSEISEPYSEQALELATRKMKEIVFLPDKESENDIFEVGEQFFLSDIDFYELGVDRHGLHSYRDDVRNLAAVIKKLSEKVIGSQCGDGVKAIELYKKYIDSMPLSRSMWRLRLFVVSLCPQTFKNYIKEYLFKTFKYEKSLELVSGAEYEQLLKKCFDVLEQNDKDDYIAQIFAFFGDKTKEKYYKNHGLQILSCIKASLAPEKITEAESIFEGKILPDYNPQPSMRQVISGSVSSKAPIDLTALSSMTIEDIVIKLKDKWSPKNLDEMDKIKDFLNPLNAEGMGALMQQDISGRFIQYIENAPLFFDRNNLDEHYTYAYLQGVYNILRENKYPADVNYENLIILIETIIASSKEDKFEIKKRDRDMYNAWLANWDAVFNSASDVLKELLGENKSVDLIAFLPLRYRLLDIINNFLLFSDPDLEDNTRENGADPFGTAINSVRGKAFQALTLFTYKDDKKFAKEDKIKISKDVKDIYEDILDKEDTYAVMFEYGHYLAPFYYRDREWAKEMFKKIFPQEPEKHNLLIASLEGYFCNNLYGELFDDLADIYNLAIEMTPEQYTKRRYFKDIDEGLATHLALAFTHFPTFTSEQPLFNLFWAKPNSKRKKEFVSFIGRHIITKEKAKDHITKSKINVEKIKNFWDWAIMNVDDKEALSGFGYWMNTEQDVLEKVWVAERSYKTLEKSGGLIEWEYGLMKSIVGLATVAPDNTLKILQAYLDSRYISKSLDGFRHSIYVDRELFDVFKILYKNPSTKDSTYQLINELLPVGNGMFWKLKDVLM